MEYLLKSSAIIFIFYACYQLFLQRDTFFESNRWFLLSGLIMASCIGFIVIPQYIEYTPITLSNVDLSTSTNASTTPIKSEPFNYTQLLYWCYFAGVIFFIGRLCIQLLSLRKLLKHGNTSRFQNYNLVESKEDIAPFSFFNFIVYNPNQFSVSELKHIINHEKAHCKQLHSIDNIIAQLACVLLWFNPFVWLYKKALLQNLEFIADQKAQYISPCEKSYQTVLLKASVQNRELVALANNFYTSLIKKRIVMLHKSKSKKWNQLKLLIVLPLLALFIMSFNIKKVYVEASKTEESLVKENKETIEIIITKNTSDDDLKSIKDTLKSKGINFIYKDVKRNSNGEIISINTEFKSDKSSSNYNISGNEGIKPFRFKSSDDNFSVGTIDKNTFIFETKNGKAKAQSTNSTSKVIVIDEDDENNSTTVDVKVINNENSNSDSEKRTFVFASSNEDSNVFINDSEAPLFIINGKEVDKSVFEDVDSDDIESVFILKDGSAIKKYGKAGKNGVIVMTKKGAKKLISEDEDTIITRKSKKSFVIKSDGEKPLYILDGKIINEEDFKDINPNNIISLDVLKDKNAIKTYGEKGKNGVFVISTKKDNKTKTLIDGDVVIIKSEEDGPWKIDTAVSSVYAINEDKRINVIEFIITKASSNAFLDQQKNDLKKHGIDAKFSKVRRNKAGEITSIKITLDDNNGRKSSASWKEKDQAIPDIVMGKSNDDKLFIRAIGN